MLQEDVRRYQRNPTRWEVDLDDILLLETQKLTKFRATVSILQGIMENWCNCCLHRDKIARLCHMFHMCVCKTFSLEKSSCVNTAEVPVVVPDESSTAGAAAAPSSPETTIVAVTTVAAVKEGSNDDDLGAIPGPRVEEITTTDLATSSEDFPPDATTTTDTPPSNSVQEISETTSTAVEPQAPSVLDAEENGAGSSSLRGPEESV